MIQGLEEETWKLATSGWRYCHKPNMMQKMQKTKKR